MTISFVKFAKAHGKIKIHPYRIGRNSMTALPCQDEDGNEIFINLPKNNIIWSSDGGILVDFNLYAEEIEEQIKNNKENLVIRLDYIEDDENPTYTLEAKDTWIDEYGVIYSLDRKRLIKGMESIENYSIEEGTEAIDDYAFDFDGCSGLKEIHLPFGLKVIGSHAFEGCKRLECIELPSTITEIGDKAFGCCHSLKKIVIPESVKLMGDGVFDGCTSLRTIIFEGVVEKIGEIEGWMQVGTYLDIGGYLYGPDLDRGYCEYGYDPPTDEALDMQFEEEYQRWKNLKILIPFGEEEVYNEHLSYIREMQINYSEDSFEKSVIESPDLLVDYHFLSLIQCVKSFGKLKIRQYEDRNVLFCINDDREEVYIEPPSIEEGSLLTLVDFTKTAKDVANDIKKNSNNLMVRYSLDEDDCLVGSPILVDYTYYDNYLMKSYEWQINKLSFHTFSDIRQISVKFINEFSDEKKDELFMDLNHGMTIPATNEQLHAYMYCFGLMHEAKLQKAFSEIPEGLFEPEIEIIDYACGQGIATLCFANFLENNDFFVEANDCATEMEKITLIEPSDIALSRASLICHKVCPNVLIDTINSDFDELESSQVATTNIQRIHLLSNVLDMTCYDINHLAKVISKISNKGDIFVCVDPWYHDNTLDGRQRKLMRLLDGKEIYHEAFNSGQLVPDKTWTAYITIFKK